MMIIPRLSFATAALAALFFSMTSSSYQQLPFLDIEEGAQCIDYDAAENTINIDCDYASFEDVIRTINYQSVLEKLEEDGEYLLKANLRVADGGTFEMNSNADDNLQYLKIAGENGIIVHGQGASRFGYGPSRDMVIKDSKFHHMWRAFYSTGAYNITIDGNEFHHNLNYAVDPHSGTHDMNITNNWVHHNPIGIICSVNCTNILIEGNNVENNIRAGIFFSRNMSDSIARNNQIYNATSGIIVSESSNNQIYDNTVEAATSEGILLFNPSEPPYDGLTEDNLVYNNTIISSATGISTTRSHDNILENTLFSNITSSEYLLTQNSSIMLVDRDFDNASIAEGGSETDNIVEIVDSGTIEVTEINDQGIPERNLYNTDNEPYRESLWNGDHIIVNS